MVDSELYESLLGSRLIHHELNIPGFSDDEYEELLDFLIDELAVYFRGDYYEFLGRNARKYHRYRAKRRFYEDFYDPLIEYKPEELTTRQQLAILKYFLYQTVNVEKLLRKKHPSTVSQKP